MNVRTLKVCLSAAFLLATTAALAENPFAGTWKIDYSKSKMTGSTVTFAPAGAGAIRLTESGMSYSFKPDGSDVTTPFGDPAQWTKVDDMTWKAVLKKGSMTLDNDTWKLADDGKSIKVSSTGTKPNGDQFNEEETFVRMTPGKGFFGKWKSTKMANDKPNSFQIDASGEDGIIWNIPEIKASVALKFDGTEVAPVGPTVPEGLTLAATRTGAHSLRLVEKIKGKVIFTGSYTVSADGKMMTEVGSAPGAVEPERVVYMKS
jgi:hypothetical protein